MKRIFNVLAATALVAVLAGTAVAQCGPDGCNKQNRASYATRRAEGGRPVLGATAQAGRRAVGGVAKGARAVGRFLSRPFRRCG